MLEQMFDDEELPLRCPGCGHETPTRLGDLKDNPQILCAGCGATIRVDAEELFEGLRTQGQAIDKLFD